MLICEESPQNSFSQRMGQASFVWAHLHSQWDIRADCLASSSLLNSLSPFLPQVVERYRISSMKVVAADMHLIYL